MTIALVEGCLSSGCGSQQPDGFIDFDLAMIDLFLTFETEGRRWHSGHPLWRDLVFAVQTHPAGAIRNSAKRALNLSERDRVPVEMPNGEFAFLL
jgi:hypothetical protein